MTFSLNRGGLAGAGRGLWLVCAGLVFILAVSAPVLARDGSDPASSRQRYVIQLQDPPLATYEGEKTLCAGSQRG